MWVWKRGRWTYERAIHCQPCAWTSASETHLKGWRTWRCFIINSLANNTNQPTARNWPNVVFFAPWSWTFCEPAGAAQRQQQSNLVQDGDGSGMESFATKKTSTWIQSSQRHSQERNQEESSSRTSHSSKGPTPVLYDVIKVPRTVGHLSQWRRKRDVKEAQARVFQI